MPSSLSTPTMSTSPLRYSLSIQTTPTSPSRSSISTPTTPMSPSRLVDSIVPLLNEQQSPDGLDASSSPALMTRLVRLSEDVDYFASSLKAKERRIEFLELEVHMTRAWVHAAEQRAKEKEMGQTKKTGGLEEYSARLGEAERRARVAEERARAAEERAAGLTKELSLLAIPLVAISPAMLAPWVALRAYTGRLFSGW